VAQTSERNGKMIDVISYLSSRPEIAGIKGSYWDIPEIEITLDSNEWYAFECFEIENE